VLVGKWLDIGAAIASGRAGTGGSVTNDRKFGGLVSAECTYTDL